MLDFKTLMKKNGLRQTDLVKFFGVSKGYMSQVVLGKEKLSPRLFTMLMENSMGWDLSMIQEEDKEVSEDVEDEEVFVPAQDEKDTIIEHQRRLIESQQRMIDGLNVTLGNLNTIISHLSEKGERTVRIA